MRCRTELHRGVAEHINYYSKGAVEQEAIISARKFRYLPSWIIGYKAGDFFVTGSGGLKCQEIIHAVTMRYPASRSNIKAVEEVVRKALEYSYNSRYKSIAFSCLGCGNGGLNKQNVIDIILNEAHYFPELKIYVYILNNKSD